ncbi:ATP-binding protein [uncultured Desulfosarcina sp.]|uniref:hybrid sensor histidine kinase/response regulator n=1 Tax=uncultured Desulfosarcina sp. TaxID=218289 RepID=UPI0029C7823B|nr:ATP-binding protein [uncultured Desulfosarcina sp.]
MSANRKVISIIILGASACLLSFLLSQYYSKKSHDNQLLLAQIQQISGRMEQIRLLSRIFIQNGDPATWNKMIENLKIVRLDLKAAPQVNRQWQKEMQALEKSLAEFDRIIALIHDPALRLKEEKTKLQNIGLSFSMEVEERIITPYRKEEGLRIYHGDPLDPFKTRIKDTAYDLVGLHIQQQLILLELLLDWDLPGYQLKKQAMTKALEKHKSQLQYMAILMGNEPTINTIIDSLDRKLSDLVIHEKVIIEHFSTLITLNGNLITAGDGLLDVSEKLSARIDEDISNDNRLNKGLSWGLLITILCGLGLLGAMLAGDIIHFVEDLKKSREDVRASESNLKVTLDSIGDAVIATDDKGVVTRMNPSAERMTGWSSAEAVGRPLPEVFCIVNGQTREQVANPAEKVLADGHVVGLANHTVLIAKNGKEIQIADSGAPICGTDGRIVGVVLVFRDVTESYAQEQKIRESEKRLKAVTANVPGVVYQFTAIRSQAYTHDFVSEKASEIFHLKADPQTFFNDFRAHLPDDEKDRFIASIHESVNRVIPWHYEGRFIKPGGKKIWFSGNAIPHEVGDAIVFYGVLMDITRRKLAEQETRNLKDALEQAQKMEAIGTLAGGIAHDFNNILSAVVGYAQLALMDTDEKSHLHHNLQQIYTAAMRAGDLVRQILAFSRQAERKPEPLQVAPLIKEAMKMLRSSLPTTIEIKQNISTRTDNVMADPTQIHQIVMNLCTNAAQSMEETGGRMTVGLEQIHLTAADHHHYPGLDAGDYIRLTIQDTGHGIAPEIKEKIFNPYFTTKDRGKGTGLGLSVVHGIVQSYGGRIYVHSKPDSGTTFDVFLPAIRDQAILERQEKSDLPTGNETILLVDDETILVEVGQQILQRLGYTVLVCSDSLEALKRFNQAPGEIDLVISDMTMPKMTGDKLAARMLQTRPDLPVILCTGFSSKFTEKEAAEIGVKALAYKPLVAAEMALLVRKVLGENKNPVGKK